MILSVQELREFITTDLTNTVLEAKLSAIEHLIRAYTNNNFQNRKIRCTSAIVDGVILAPSTYFADGDTVQITDSALNDGLFVYHLADNSVVPHPFDCEDNLITKVEYPPDIKMGVINLMHWDLNKRDKLGIASETISRHSVSYTSMDGSNSSHGFPSALMGFLKPYMKARF